MTAPERTNEPAKKKPHTVPPTAVQADTDAHTHPSSYCFRAEAISCCIFFFLPFFVVDSFIFVFLSDCVSSFFLVADTSRCTLPTIDLFVRLVNLPERTTTSSSSFSSFFSSFSNCSGGPFLLNDQRIKANPNVVVRKERRKKKKKWKELEIGRLPFRGAFN